MTYSKRERQMAEQAIRYEIGMRVDREELLEKYEEYDEEDFWNNWEEEWLPENVNLYAEF